MGEKPRVASVTLRDIAEDVGYWTRILRQAPNDVSVRSKAIAGLENLVEVLQGYDSAGFMIAPGGSVQPEK